MYQRGLKPSIYQLIILQDTFSITLEEWQMAAVAIDDNLRLVNEMHQGQIHPPWVHIPVYNPDAMDIDNIGAIS